MKKIAYLTIDDSPSKDFCKKIEYLKKLKIPAIIFCIGKEIKKYEEDIIYAIKNGFIIGNHSYNHNVFYTLTISKIKQEIKKTDEIISSCYLKANVKRPVKVFRFPWGDIENRNAKKIQEFLKGLGYKSLNFRGVNYDFFKRYYEDKRVDIFWTFSIMEYGFSSENDIE